jgi:peptidyl-prolyl cis-trans isomerase C
MKHFKLKMRRSNQNDKSHFSCFFLLTYVFSVILLSSNFLYAQEKKDIQNLETEEKDLPQNVEVANVNGYKIFLDELNTYYQSALLIVGNHKVTKERALLDLVNRRIALEKAQKNKLDKDPSVTRLIDELLYNAQISRDLEKEFAKITVSDKELESYYKKNKEYRVLRILLRTPVVTKTDSERENTEKALAQIHELHKQVSLNPDKFKELAQKYTQLANYETGGDTGYSAFVQFPIEEREVLPRMKVGDISPIIKSQLGFSIIKLEGIRGYEEAMKNKVLYQKLVYDEKRDRIIHQYFEKERKSAQVKIRSELVKD